jgi:hypothetical protein
MAAIVFDANQRSSWGKPVTEPGQCQSRRCGSLPHGISLFLSLWSPMGLINTFLFLELTFDYTDKIFGSMAFIRLPYQNAFCLY